jgi:probable HAF family extracellular repeat protein
MARFAVRTAFLSLILALVTTAGSHAQAGYTLIRLVSPFGQAHDINNQRQVVGATGEGRAFVWQDGSFAELPLLRRLFRHRLWHQRARPNRRYRKYRTGCRPGHPLGGRTGYRTARPCRHRHRAGVRHQ